MAEWTPNERQVEFFSLPLTIKEALYGGGVNSAKTEALVMYPLVHKWHEMERFKQVIMRRTHPELKREVLPRAKRFYRPFGAQWNGQDNVFTFPSGAQVWLGHCETEDDVHKYDSMEINLFCPDEITSLTEDQYLYIAFERVRAPIGSGLPKIIRAAGMPGDKGHTWVKKRFIDPYKKRGITNLYDCSEIPIVGKGDNLRIYIHATVADNPHADPDYVKSLDALNEAERKAKKYGDWDAYLGTVFDEFREKHYTDEPENALHVIEPFNVPDYWPRIVIGDWGYRAYTWIGFGAVSPDGRLYVYRELYWQKTKISEWAPIVKQFVDSESPRVIRFCKSAKQDRGQEQTIQQQIEQALGRTIELTESGDGSRIAGKTLLHEYLRWKEAPKITKKLEEFDDEHAQWLLRNASPTEYHNYIDSFAPQVPEVLPKLQIFNSCKLLIGAIKQCEYAKPQNNKPAEDVAEFDGDDPYDGIRYMLEVAHRYVNDAKRDFTRIQEQERIKQEFEQHHDWNIVFARGRAMDKAAKSNSITMRRYH